MKKIVVVVGAGASYQSETDAAPFVENLRPPLTSQLFSCAHRPEFYNVLSRYPGAQKLAHGLAEKAKFGVLNLEVELRRLAESEDPRIRRYFEDIPCYLAGLMQLVSKDFTDLAGGYFQLVQALLADSSHEVVFVSLNYDFLLEKALEAFDSSITFHNVWNYCNETNKVQVVKPHGSADWSLDLQQFISQESWNAGASLTFPGKPWNIKVDRRSHRRSGGHVSCYPVITAPMASKSSEEFVCPPSHMSILAEHCKGAEKLLIIGSSCVDEDVFGFLGQHLPSGIPYQAVGEFNVMGPPPMALELSAHLDLGIKAGDMGWPSNNFLACGFRQYLHTTQFRDFLAL